MDIVEKAEEKVEDIVDEVTNLKKMVGNNFDEFGKQVGDLMNSSKDDNVDDPTFRSSA